MSAVASSFVSSTVSAILVGLAAVSGAAVLFLFKEMFLHWQLVAPPVVGGYLAALACGFDEPIYSYAVWASLTLVSVALHVRRRKINTWLERKQDLAVHSKESQIVNAMRSANPALGVDEFEKLKERLLGAVDGDREQVDRIVFGGGLY
jgi:membrane protein implicated in regulation of membrane protease activity